MAKYFIELVKCHVVQVEAETQEEAKQAVALMTDAEIESAVVDYWQKWNVKEDLYEIRFNDGKVNFIVATDLCYDECEKLIKRQEEPSFYKIEKLEPSTEN